MSLLENLPTELIEAISYQLPLQSVSALRLTSRTLKSKTLHVFKNRFFRQRTIKLAWGSLQRFLAILQNDTFRPMLTHLIIRAEVFIQNRYPTGFGLGSPIMREDHLALRTLTPQKREHIRRRSVEHHGHHHSGESSARVQNMLVCALKKLSFLPQLSLQYAEYDSAMGPSRPRPMTFALSNRSGAELRIAVATGVFSAVMSALASANLPVGRLQVYDNHWGGIVALSAFKDVSAAQYFGLASTLENLKELRLCITTRHRNFRAPDEATLALPAALFAILPALEVLDLSMWIPGVSDPPQDTLEVLGHIAAGAKLTKLKRCTLSRLWLDANGLRGLLLPAKTTLKNVALLNNTVPDAEQLDVLGVLAHELDLDEVFFEDQLGETKIYTRITNGTFSSRELAEKIRSNEVESVFVPL